MTNDETTKLEKELSKELIETLKKYNLYERLLSIPNDDDILSVESDDIIEMLKAEEFKGYIDGIYKIKNKIEPVFISDNHSISKMLIYMSTKESMSLYDVDYIIKELKNSLSNEIDIVYGCHIDESLDDGDIRITAIIV